MKQAFLITEDNQPEKLEFKKWAGTAYTVIYRPHNGFANFAIVELKIQDGKVVDMEMGQALAAFETKAKLEAKVDQMVEKMRQDYPAEFRHV